MVVYFVHARLAQLVEQLIYTHQVGGSSPSARTNKNLILFYQPNNGLPQWKPIIRKNKISLNLLVVQYS